MEQEFQKAKELVEKSSCVLLTMHERMDGDDGGSVLALAQALEKMGKKVTCVIKGGVPQALAFLPGSQNIEDNLIGEIFDLLIMCGCANRERCGIQKIIDLKLPILNIDHHPDNSLFGQVNVVDAKKSSVAELVYDLFKFCRWPINKDIATALLTGIITDTGSFMHSNTNVSTLKAAAELMRKGAQVTNIVRHAYKSKTPQTLKAWGKAMENSYYDANHKILYSVITEQDIKELGDLPPATFEGFVETLNTVPEAKFVLFLRQDGNVIKGSLRSDSFKNVDVAKIAQLYGGGGHRLAAGFSVIGKLEKDNSGKWRVR
jgi:phosphoesterase RecJ-like protein